MNYQFPTRVSICPVTQNWGAPNQGQQWPNQQPWGQPTNTWGAPPPTPQQVANPWANALPPQPAAAPWAATPQYQQPIQAQFGPPGYGAPGSFSPPPKRRRPILNVILGSALILGLGFFTLALSNYLSQGTNTTAAPPPTQPTATIPSGVPDPDSNPPSAPRVKNATEATAWTKSNAAYKQSITVPTKCGLPAIDASKASEKEMQAHLDLVTACLWTVWNPPVTSAGFELPRPPVTVYTSSVTTPCGSFKSGNAFYCPANQQIYYATDIYDVLPTKQLQRTTFLADLVIAHEFGHAIQYRTGILSGSSYFENRSTASEANLYSRRAEAQADCLSGMFVTSVSQSSNLTEADLKNLKLVVYNLGDDVLSGDAKVDGNHGLGKSRQTWFSTGLASSSIGGCNSYTAPAEKVR